MPQEGLPVAALTSVLIAGLLGWCLEVVYKALKLAHEACKVPSEVNKYCSGSEALSCC